MMRHDRALAGLGLLVGLTATLALAAPGCLRTLDESLIGQNQPDGGGGTGGASGSGGSGGASGSGGSAGASGSGGSGGSAGADGGGTGGTSGGGGSGGQPDAGFTPYDPVAHPGKDLFHVSALGLPVVIAADNVDVFQVKKGDANGGTIIATPVDGTASTPVTGADVTRAIALAAPTPATSSLFVYYVGGTSGIGEIGRYLKAPNGSPNPKVPITPDAAIEQAVGLAIGGDGYAYLTAVAVAKSPTVLRFSLGTTGTTADTLYTSTTGGEQSGDVTESAGCVYWISNGAIWVIPSTGAIVRKAALAAEISDAVGLASDNTNFYYTRSNGEVWQRKLSPAACDGSGPPEQRIAEGYTNIGDVIVYAPDTVAWAAQGDSSNNFAGGGIFTTPVGGYDVVQIAPETGGVGQIADAGLYVAYGTSTGFIRRVLK